MRACRARSARRPNGCGWTRSSRSRNFGDGRAKISPNCSDKPALAAGLNRLQIDPTDMSDTLRILQDRIISLEFAKKITFTYQSLVDSYRLSERYSNDVSQPLQISSIAGKRRWIRENGLITSQSVVESIEQTIGVAKVGGTLTQNDSEEREKLLNL